MPEKRGSKLESKNESTENEEVQSLPSKAPPRTTRLSVNISRDTVDALQFISDERGISVTEAVRRLIGYGFVVYKAIREGGEVLIRRGDKVEKIVILD